MRTEKKFLADELMWLRTSNYPSLNFRAQGKNYSCHFSHRFLGSGIFDLWIFYSQNQETLLINKLKNRPIAFKNLKNDPKLSKNTKNNIKRSKVTKITNLFNNRPRSSKTNQKLMKFDIFEQ